MWDKNKKLIKNKKERKKQILFAEHRCYEKFKRRQKTHFIYFNFQNDEECTHLFTFNKQLLATTEQRHVLKIIVSHALVTFPCQHEIFSCSSYFYLFVYP